MRCLACCFRTVGGACCGSTGAGRRRVASRASDRLRRPGCRARHVCGTCPAERHLRPGVCGPGGCGVFCCLGRPAPCSAPASAGATAARHPLPSRAAPRRRFRVASWRQGRGGWRRASGARGGVGCGVLRLRRVSRSGSAARRRRARMEQCRRSGGCGGGAQLAAASCYVGAAVARRRDAGGSLCCCTRPHASTLAARPADWYRIFTHGADSVRCRGCCTSPARRSVPTGPPVSHRRAARRFPVPAACAGASGCRDARSCATGGAPSGCRGHAHVASAARAGAVAAAAQRPARLRGPLLAAGGARRSGLRARAGRRRCRLAALPRAARHAADGAQSPPGRRAPCAAAASRRGGVGARDAPGAAAPHEAAAAASVRVGVRHRGRAPPARCRSAHRRHGAHLAARGAPRAHAVACHAAELRAERRRAIRRGHQSCSGAPGGADAPRRRRFVCCSVARVGATRRRCCVSRGGSAHVVPACAVSVSSTASGGSCIGGCSGACWRCRRDPAARRRPRGAGACSPCCRCRAQPARRAERGAGCGRRGARVRAARRGPGGAAG